MSTTPQKRLSSEDRRLQLLEHAARLFADNGYAATSTALLAKSMGVTEPVLYRHFSGKKSIYVACIENAWSTVREALEGELEAEKDPGQWMPRLGIAGLAVLKSGDHGRLWLNALTDRSLDEDVRKVVQRNLNEVHQLIVGVIEGAQSRGGIPNVRNARAEAWMFVGIGMLQAVSEPGSGPTDEDLDAIRAARRDWLSAK